MSYRNLNKIEIDLTALRFNLRSLKKRLPTARAGIIAVVKSDAYGHGITQISRVLEKEGVWGFGISELEEAAVLRKNGITSPILLLSGLFPGGEKDAFDLKVTVGVTDRQTLALLEKEGQRRNEILDIHLKVDTGMSRLGFTPEQLLETIVDRKTWPHLNFTGLYSHLSSADEPDDPFNQMQLCAFRKIVQEVRETGWRPRIIHLANSAGTIHFPDDHYDAVRPGLSLYGAYPGEKSRNCITLKPVMRFSSRVIAVRTLPPGTSVGYGHAFTTPGKSKIAILPVGYDDGYVRALSKKAEVLIQGRRCPVIGNICMKALMVDVSKLDTVKPGDEAVLLGSQQKDNISIEELSKWASTISYELLCLLGSRNTKIFKGD